MRALKERLKGHEEEPWSHRPLAARCSRLGCCLLHPEEEAARGRYKHAFSTTVPRGSIPLLCIRDTAMRSSRLMCLLVLAASCSASVGWQGTIPGTLVAPSACASAAVSVRLASPRACATAAPTAGEAIKPLKPPPSCEEMLSQAAGAVKRAQADGKSRCTLRLFVPRGDERNLYPPDESWEGGIMQLYYACSPLVRDLLRRLSSDDAGVPPAITEQRLDESGVDGESVWFAQSKRASDDAVGLVQPSVERMETIKQLSSDAGSRLLLLVNPQWKVRASPHTRHGALRPLVHVSSRLASSDLPRSHPRRRYFPALVACLTWPPETRHPNCAGTRRPARRALTKRRSPRRAWQLYGR